MYTHHVAAAVALTAAACSRRISDPYCACAPRSMGWLPPHVVCCRSLVGDAVAMGNSSCGSTRSCSAAPVLRQHKLARQSNIANTLA